LNYIIFRPHNVYGERQNIADRYRNVIGIFMNQTIQGRPMSIFGNGKQTRAFTHIDDVAPIVAGAPEVHAAYNQIFNLGADVPHTIIELAEEISIALERPLSVQYFPSRHEVLHAFADHSKARSVFGSSVPLSLRDGLRRMAKWVLSHGPVIPTRFDGIEIEENLPLAWRQMIDEQPVGRH
jgi:UDP-glucose 4-epimerase